jgi:DNA-binding XRE family transcriptional regulator
MEKMLETVTRENCGRVLKMLRNKFGSMTLEDFAKTLGVSRSTVMRIEDGRTLPSDEFLNRLKALQLIGASKFGQLSSKDKTHFTNLVEEINEDPELILKALKDNMLKKLTPFGILAGLGTIGGAALITSSSTISSIPILSSLAGYGLIKALKTVLESNNLMATEVDGRWEIIIKPKTQKKEIKDGNN